MKKLLLALLLAFPTLAMADGASVVAPARLAVVKLTELPALEVTGVVVGPKIRNAAIIDDQIIWEGDAYRVKGEVTDLKVIKIEMVKGQGQVTFEHNGEKFVRSIKKRTK